MHHSLTHPTEPPSNGATDSAVMSGAPSSTLTGAASAPAAPEFTVIDGLRTRHQKDLADMIGALRAVSDEIKAKWIEIAATNLDAESWTNLDHATAHLLRLSSDLHNDMLDCQVRLAFSRRKAR